MLFQNLLTGIIIIGCILSAILFLSFSFLINRYLHSGLFKNSNREEINKAIKEHISKYHGGDYEIR